MQPALAAVPVPEVEVRRLLLTAALHRIRTTRMEVTAARWVDRRRHVPGQQHTLGLLIRIGHRDRRKQRLGVGMRRPRKQVLRLGQLHDLPEIHHGDAVADVSHDREIVGDEQIAEPELLLQVHQQIEDLRLNRHVERRDRFVADDELRI
jgi:hypothetical protein